MAWFGTKGRGGCGEEAVVLGYGHIRGSGVELLHVELRCALRAEAGRVRKRP